MLNFNNSVSKNSGTWAIGGGVASAVFILSDLLFRQLTGWSPFGPTSFTFWMGMGLGAAWGLIGSIWQYVGIRRFPNPESLQHAIAEFGAMSRAERIQWRNIPTTLLLSSWCYVLLGFGLIGWCLANNVICLWP